jgi:hypothetical protein
MRVDDQQRVRAQQWRAQEQVTAIVHDCAAGVNRKLRVLRINFAGGGVGVAGADPQQTVLRREDVQICAVAIDGDSWRVVLLCKGSGE